eukprot:122303_1
MDELDNDEDGVTAWAKLIKYFEQSTKEVRVEHLLHQWENDALKPGEHPDELYGRLTAMRRRLEKHREVTSDANLTRRFVSAIERQEGNKYSDVITFYRGQMILNNPWNISNLREFLTYVHVSKSQVTDSPTKKGLGSITGCTYCGKTGHKEDDCWNKHPKNGKLHSNGKDSPPKPRECWECSKVGHVRRNCPKKSINRPHINAAITGNFNK